MEQKKQNKLTTANQYERIIWLHNKMKTDRIDYDEYHWKFDKSRRTFNRDIESLKYKFTAPVKCKNGEYFYSEKAFSLPTILLSEKELYGLAISSYVVEAYKDSPLYQSLKKIMSRLSNLLSDDVNYVYLDNNNIKTDKIRDFNWENIIKITRAINNNKVVEMKYSSFNSGKTEVRKVDPIYLYNWRGEFYFVGWCHNRKAFRDFFIGRIKDFKITSEKAKTHNFNPDKYFSDKLWGIIKGGEEVNVKFKVKKKIKPWVSERFGDRVKFLEGNKIWVTFSVDVIINKDFIKWILGWGDDIMVLEPVSVQKRVIEYCTGILGLYKGVLNDDV